MLPRQRIVGDINGLRVACVDIVLDPTLLSLGLRELLAEDMAVLL